MGGTRDGEVYGLHRENWKQELEKLEKQTGQTLVPLSESEAELAKTMDNKEARAKIFQEKAETNKDLENEMRD